MENKKYRLTVTIVLIFVYTLAVAALKFSGLISWGWLLIFAPALLFCSAFAAFSSLVILVVIMFNDKF